MSNRGRVSLVGAALSLITTTILAGCTPAPTPLLQTSLCSNTTLNTTKSIQDLFNRFHNAAWGGADGTDSVALPDGRTLLTFGDTLQDPKGLNANGSRPANYRFRHNSMMLMSSKCLGALTKSDYSEPFPTNSDGSYYWPGQPAVQRRPGNAAGDRIIIPALRTKTTRPGDTFGFQTLGTDLFVFDLLPNKTPVYETKYAMPTLAASQNIMFGSGAYINDGNWLYLVGGRHNPSTMFASDVYLARVSLAQLDKPVLYQYFSGRVSGHDMWSTSPTYAVPLASPDPVTTSGPSGGNDIIPVKNGVAWVDNSDEFGGPGIQAWASSSLTQAPYTRSALLQPAASTSKYYSYGGAAHPAQRLADGKLLVTWCRNPVSSTDLTANGNSYMPQVGEISQLNATSLPLPPVVQPTPPPVVVPPPPVISDPPVVLPDPPVVQPEPPVTIPQPGATQPTLRMAARAATVQLPVRGLVRLAR